jgi:hypothetical protein
MASICCLSFSVMSEMPSRSASTSFSVSVILALRYSACSFSPEPTFRRLLDAIATETSTQTSSNALRERA